MAIDLKKAQQIMSYSETEPPHLPSLNALRCLKYKKLEEDLIHHNVLDAISEIKYMTLYKECIYDIGLDKFFVKYWTPLQLQCYNEYQRKHRNITLIVDATGSVVKKISRPFRNKSGSIFLYQCIVTEETGKVQFPVCQMLSERHDNIAIHTWFEDWKRSGIISTPKTVICDRSLALLSGIVKSFTQYKSLSEYYDSCYKILFDNQIDLIPNCFIRCDIAHTIKNITRWQPVRQMPSGVKNFYVRRLAEVLKAGNMSLAKSLIYAILMVADSEYIDVNELTTEDSPTEKARKLLKKAISNVDFEESYFQSLTEEEQLAEEHHLDGVVEEIMECQNPFENWANKLHMDVKGKSQSTGEHLNALYCPQIIKYVINLTKDLPLVPGVMIPVFGHGKPRASSALVESYFNNLKNRIFKNDQLPMRMDWFLIKHILHLDGLVKLAAPTQIESPTKGIELLVSLSPDSTGTISSPAPTPLKNNESTRDGTASEDAARENWRNQGYSQAPVKRLKEQLSLKKQKRRKLNSIRSYLVRQPDLMNLEITKSAPRAVGLLKNGNRASELKTLTYYGGESVSKVTLTNTCAFDSFAQVTSCAYNDSSVFKELLETKINGTTSGKFLNFCKELATKGVTVQTYKNRFELLLATFPNLEACPGELGVLNTESTAENIINKMTEEYPTFHDVMFCRNCRVVQMQRTSCLKIIIPATGLKGLPNYITELVETQKVKCENASCLGVKTITRKPYGMWLIIEIINICDGKFENTETNLEQLDSDVLTETEVQMIFKIDL